MSTATADLDRLTQGMSVAEKLKLVSAINKVAWHRATAPIDPPPQLMERVVATQDLPDSHPDKQEVTSKVTAFVNAHTLSQLRLFLLGGRLEVPGLDHPVAHPGLVFTVDEHDALTPVKRLPHRAYFPNLLELWVNNQITAVPKSRQIMITWFFCSVAAWMVLQPHKNIAIVCKEANGSDKLLIRIEHILKNLPPGCEPPPWNARGLEKVSGELRNHSSSSLISGLKENAEKQMRQNTYSWVFSDESAFQEGFVDQYEAALPTLRGGGRYTMVSTPDGEDEFYHLISDDDTIPLPSGR